MSDWVITIPGWLFATRGKLILAGLGVYTLLLPIVRPISHDIPSCFRIGGSVQALPTSDGDLETAVRHNPASMLLSDRVISAMAVCQPDDCNETARNTYRSAMFWYSSRRAAITARLTYEFGNDGLKRAQELYSRPVDREIEDALRARNDSGVFDIWAQRQNGTLLAILAYKGAEDFVPCPSPHSRLGGKVI